MPTVIRRTDQVSKTMQSVIAKSVEQYHQIHKQVKEAQEIVPKVPSNQIPLSTAIASGRFAYKGFDLYKEADTDTEFGRIWVKREIVDPKTGERKEWLVVYTSDDQEIIRQIASEALSDLNKRAWHNTGTYVQYYDDNNELQSGKVVGMVAGRIRIENNNGAIDEVDESQIVNDESHLGNNVDVYANKDNSLKLTAANPNPKDVPIAPGIKSKNITIDESGAQGTAKVTVEFSDVDQGLQFYQNDIATGQAKPEKTPDTDKENSDGEEKTPENTNAEQAPAQGDAITVQPGQAQVAPGPMPAGLPGQASVRSNTLKKQAEGGLDSFQKPHFFDPLGDNSEPNTDPEESRDAFGQTLIVGDPVREDGGDRRGVIKELNKDVAKVMWDESRADFSNFTDDQIDASQFAMQEAVSVIPTSKLVKWASPTVRKMSRGGAQVVDIIKEIYNNSVKYAFVNEAGQKVGLNISNPKTGAQLQRPDTKQTARVGNIIEKVFSSKDSIAAELTADMDKDIPGTVEDAEEEKDDDKEASQKKASVDWDLASEIEQRLKSEGITGPIEAERIIREEFPYAGTITVNEVLERLKQPSKLDSFDPMDTMSSIAASLVKEAIDISDQISPMGWTTQGEDNAPVGAGPNLPPNQDLNSPQNNPNDTSNANTVYDTSKGQSPSFQTTIDPDDQSVKIKFIPNEQQQKLDQTVQNQGQQPAAQPTPNPAPPQQQPVNPMQSNQPSFEDMNIPNNF